jgi:hypothetical protein
MVVGIRKYIALYYQVVCCSEQVENHGFPKSIPLTSLTAYRSYSQCKICIGAGTPTSGKGVVLGGHKVLEEPAFGETTGHRRF